jgi:hypothetical protein
LYVTFFFFGFFGLLAMIASCQSLRPA